jgi:pimeloyl-ACP methyl ester carboxylesterase
MKQILLLHGAIGSKDQLIPLIEKLKGNAEIHTLNFSGHGGANLHDSFSIETFAKDVLIYLEENKIGKINIFGYSMGGYVALYLAKYHPDKIDSVFTLATKFNWTPEIAAKETKLLDAAKISEKIPAFAKTLEERHAPNDWKDVLKRTSEMMIRMGNNNPLSLEDLETIEKKALIGVGDKDTMVTLGETIEVYRRLKNGGLIVFPNTQHPIEKMDMEKLKNEIIDFLKS